MSQKKIYRLSRYGINLFKTNTLVGGFNQNCYQRIYLLLDTGSSFTILPRQVLKHLGYNLTHPLRYQLMVFLHLV